MEDMISYFLILLLLTGLPVLTVAGFVHMKRCEEKEQRQMRWAAYVFLGALVLLAGGWLVMGRFGLIWRAAPTAVLMGTMLVSDWVWIGLMLYHVLCGEWPGTPPVWRWTVKSMIALFATAALLMSLVWWTVLCALFGEGLNQVVEYQGQTLVEVVDGLLEADHYSYYRYYGPLVRGTEPVYEN